MYAHYHTATNRCPRAGTTLLLICALIEWSIRATPLRAIEPAPTPTTLSFVQAHPGTQMHVADDRLQAISEAPLGAAVHRARRSTF